MTAYERKQAKIAEIESKMELQKLIASNNYSGSPVNLEARVTTLELQYERDKLRR